MSRLKWDEAGKRFYENGVSHAVLYTQDEPGTDYRYKGKPKKITVAAKNVGINIDNIAEGDDFNLYYYDQVLSRDEILNDLSKVTTVFSQGLLPTDNTVVSTTIYYYPNLTYAIVTLVFSKSLNYSVSYNALSNNLEVGTNPIPFFSNGVGLQKNLKISGQDYYFGTVWNGITSISENPDGADANDMWADNVKYSSPRSIETYGLTVEAYTYPDEFAYCDGSEQPKKGVRLGQQKRKQFCLSYRTEIGSDADTESGYILHLIYGCTASPSDRSYETINDSPDALTFSWEVESNPIPFEDVDFQCFKPVSSISINTTKLNAFVTDTIGSRYFNFSSGNLEKLENILYGTNDTVAIIPSPDVVLSCFEEVLEEEEEGSDEPIPDPEISTD